MTLSLVKTAYAATTNVAAFGSVLQPIINTIVNPIVELAFAVAIVVFVYGVIQMVIHGAEAEGHTLGKQSMIWGLVGMFIMMSAWGIINLVANTVKQF